MAGTPGPAERSLMVYMVGWRKGAEQQDYAKARWYLDRLIGKEA